MHAMEVMTKNPITCGADNMCSHAAKLMWDRDCGVVPVIDESSKLIGIITDRDICMATYTQGRAPHEIRVGDVMCKQVYTVQAESSLKEIESTMRRYQVRRLPVVDTAGKLVGMLSLNDLARVLSKKTASKEDGIKVLSQVLADICQPRPQA